MIRITFLDGQTVDVNESTVLIGIDNYSKDDGYYLQQMYNSSMDKNFMLSSCDERLGIGGFLLSHKLFTLGEDPDETLYMTSAVKSISVV